MRLDVEGGGAQVGGSDDKVERVVVVLVEGDRVRLVNAQCKPFDAAVEDRQLSSLAKKEAESPGDKQSERIGQAERALVLDPLRRSGGLCDWRLRLDEFLVRERVRRLPVLPHVLHEKEAQNILRVDLRAAVSGAPASATTDAPSRRRVGQRQELRESSGAP